MAKTWESTIYPIIVTALMDSIDEEQLSDDECVRISNIICREIDKKYAIERKL